ncbi:hypothetical protein EZV62_002908 [Acer yangbiense]|uniref:RRM domain-containing protein n=1 Tax=Acer yangbiense TaxID=1000413 RepID=A0A5C7IYW0_9ROSI|nr:hypothetical protein EZV62_002908 [Acer yangbiense]
MNPLMLVKRIQNINSKEAALGISEEASWHTKYKDSAYVYVSGIPFDLTEGDLLAVSAQFNRTIAASKAYGMAATEASLSLFVSGGDCINPFYSSLASNGTALSSSAVDFLSLCHRLKVRTCFWLIYQCGGGDRIGDGDRQSNGRMSFSKRLPCANELSIDQEAERKIGWLLKLIIAGTATAFGYQFFPYIVFRIDFHMSYVVETHYHGCVTFESLGLGASRLACFAIDNFFFEAMIITETFSYVVEITTSHYHGLLFLRMI